MKKQLHFILTAIIGFSAVPVDAQRYYDEVFNDEDIVVHSDISFGTNIDFLTSDLSDEMVTTQEAGELLQAVNLGNDIPAAYFDPEDESTNLKVTTLVMDIYEPDQEVDLETERPVIIYVHTGNFLPPVVNGSPNGLKTDSAAVELCRQWAKRGYVAVSIDYRLGWNPIAATVQERRGTLLNAVYRAIQDVKEGVRFLRGDAFALNTYAIDEGSMVLYGQGSGGYVVQAYTTLDNPDVELFLPEFLLDPFDPTSSYVQQAVVGDPEGFNGALTLYQDEGLTSEVHMSINAGGALADESWLEEGDVPMCAINCIRDDFAPFDAGTVIVPTTQEQVVPVEGANIFIQKANDLGNNDVFADLPDGDPYTDRARSLYGETFDVSLGGEITVAASPEGLFPIELPLTSYLTNQASPWEWWDPNSPLAQAEVQPGLTAHQASLSSNPDMSPEKGRTYLDSIQGYILPRIMCALDLPENLCSESGPDNDDCANAEDINDWIPAVESTITTDPYSNEGATSDGDPEEGWDCFGEPDGTASDPQVDNSVWFTFEGDGNEYTILTNDCSGTLGEDYITDGDTQMALYSGNDCGSLVPVDCNEDSEDAPDGDFYSEITVLTEAGTTYYILIDGFDDTDLGGEGPSEGSFCLNITNNSVGVVEYTALDFDLFPNPTKGNFTIQANETINGVRIYNVVGALVKDIPNVNNTNLIIDGDQMEAGIYVVNVELASGIQTSRLIVE